MSVHKKVAHYTHAAPPNARIPNQPSIPSLRKVVPTVPVAPPCHRSNPCAGMSPLSRHRITNCHVDPWPPPPETLGNYFFLKKRKREIAKNAIWANLAHSERSNAPPEKAFVNREREKKNRAPERREEGGRLQALAPGRSNRMSGRARAWVHCAIPSRCGKPEATGPPRARRHLLPGRRSMAERRW